MSRQNLLMRQRIAQLAARLMAQDGIQDFALAKRKALRQLGAEDSRNLPTNAEIEQELRLYQDIFQGDERHGRLSELRRIALDAMRMLEAFEPRLTGAVLSGSVTRHSPIELEVFCADPKEFALFLLNRRIPHRAGEKIVRLGGEARHLPWLTLTDFPAEVRVVVFGSEDARGLPRFAADGRTPLRARLSQLGALFADDAPSPAGFFENGHS
jgi:hypothetical protein